MKTAATVKVTRHRQVTIPSHLANQVGIKEGDLLDVRLEDQSILLKKSEHELPHFKIARKKRLKDSEIESLIESSLGEMVD